jgi:hypothetical protein
MSNLPNEHLAHASSGARYGDLHVCSRPECRATIQDIPDKAEADVLFMVVEKFRNQDGKAVYRKLRDSGRGLPDGLKFVASYVTADLGRCFQLMETDDVTLFQRWVADWQDAVEFEVVPVIEGKKTREALAPLL